MSTRNAVAAMPKVELHVHLEGAIRPETLLHLADRNGIRLPAGDIDGLRAWYRFTDFPHFAEVYQVVSACIRSADDIELMARDFLRGQADQNILHTEATYTALAHYRNVGLPFDEQLDAINRARAWAAAEFGISLSLIVDIPRDYATDAEALMIADWVIGGHGKGVVALGLGGYEVGFPPERFAPAFDRVREAGVPAVVHAGETEGPASIRGALDTLHSVRIGHGVRCLEDPDLVAELRERQIPLEVCPTSNVCLNVTPSLAEHPLPALLSQGLYVTLNSDDPPMFGTTLTGELIGVAETFGYDDRDLRDFQVRAAQVALLDDDAKAALINRVAGA